MAEDAVVQPPPAPRAHPAPSARGLERYQTPLLLIRLDQVRRNVQAMLRLAGAPERWRPHVKTVKIPQVLDLLLAAGVRHFKCATTREAALLLSRARQPIDLLIAMAHHGANLRRCAELARAYSDHRLSLLTEDAAHAGVVRDVAPTMGLWLDVDPGYGRTGAPIADVARHRAAIQAAGGVLRGVHFYEGHVVGGTAAERQARCAPLYAACEEVVRRARETAGRELELVTSGTPTFTAALAWPGFRYLRHQVSPGTVVYFDTNSEALELEGFVPAATVLTRVISAPAADRVTCDAGSKAIDAAVADPCCRVQGHAELHARRPSEEHLPLARDGSSAAAAPAPGTLLELVPRHVCPTVNLADEALLLDGGDVFGLVPVAARGHEHA